MSDDLEEDVSGEGWQLRHDEGANETWLIVDEARGLRVGERRVELLLPKALAEFLDVAWRNRANGPRKEGEP